MNGYWSGKKCGAMSRRACLRDNKSMQVDDKFWVNLVSNPDSGHEEKLSGLLSINSELKDEVFFNNVGVYYEQIGEHARAKAFYLKSLSENVLNMQTWKNLLSLQHQMGNESELLNLTLFFLQSTSFLQVYFLLLTIILIKQYVRYKNESLSIKKIIQKMFPLYFILIILTFVNDGRYFYVINEKQSLHDGPSSIFQNDDEIKSGKMLLTSKKNNEFIKVIKLTSPGDNSWVRANGLIKL